MIFIATIILGIIAYESLPVSLMPDIPIPLVTVSIKYKYNSAREMENGIVKPIRSELLQVSHLKEIKSETSDGLATINLKFDYGTNIDLAFIDVNERIDRCMTYLPRDMDRPRLVKASATDIPVFYLNLSLKSEDSLHFNDSDESIIKFMELSEFSETVIRKRIEQLPEVALVDISGYVSPQLTIEPDTQKMKILNFSIDQFEYALDQNNINVENMIIRDGQYQYNVRLSSLLRSKEDVENIFIKQTGRIFLLKDLAKISLEPQKRNGMFLSNNKPAITMALIKQSTAKMDRMKDRIESIITELNKDYPEIEFEITQNQTQLLDYSISNLKQNLYQGLLLVFLVVIFFMKDIKLPILIGFSLLVSIVVSMLFFKIANLSINIMSLSGLILAAGNMMDNSIVVTDNITQYRDNNYSIDEACVKGTEEIIIPQFSSMLVNLSVFLPLIFLSGIAGALLFDEAISLTIGLSISYIIGITLMPVIYRLSFKKVFIIEKKFQKVKERFFVLLWKRSHKLINIDNYYASILNFTFRYKKINLLLYFMFLPMGVIALFFIKKEKMPNLTQVETILSIDWNENINVGENKFRTIRLLQALKPEVVQSNAYIGEQQFLLNNYNDLSVSETKIYIKAKNPNNVKIIEKKAKTFIRTEYSQAQINFEPPTSVFEKIFNDNSPLVAELTMIDSKTETDIHALLKLNTEINNDNSLSAINRIPLQEHILLTINMENLLLYNVTYEALIKELKTYFKENNIGIIHSSQKYMPLVVSNKEMLLTDIINTKGITNNQNVIVPFNKLVTISKEQELKKIVSGKEGEFIPLYFSLNNKQVNSFINKINSHVKNSGIFNVRFSGSVFSNIELLKEIGILLIISLMLLYFILAAQFESLKQPFLVLIEIPIDLAAAMIVLYISGQSLNLMSAMGLVIMMGIIITDSILKLDAINHLRKEGYSVMEAIKIGGHRRLRAIIMTSLTSILAMVPLLFTKDLGSELQKPFSYALIGGMIVGTIVSLFLVPLAYWYIYKPKDKESIHLINND
jgi:multidrug efflux pump subunit AcrB